MYYSYFILEYNNDVQHYIDMMIIIATITIIKEIIEKNSHYKLLYRRVTLTGNLLH